MLLASDVVDALGDTDAAVADAADAVACPIALNGTASIDGPCSPEGQHLP